MTGGLKLPKEDLLNKLSAEELLDKFNVEGVSYEDLEKR